MDAACYHAALVKKMKKNGWRSRGLLDWRSCVKRCRDGWWKIGPFEGNFIPVTTQHD